MFARYKIGMYVTPYEGNFRCKHLFPLFLFSAVYICLPFPLAFFTSTSFSLFLSVDLISLFLSTTNLSHFSFCLYFSLPSFFLYILPFSLFVSFSLHSYIFTFLLPLYLCFSPSLSFSPYRFLFLY